MRPNRQETADLVTFTEKNLKKKTSFPDGTRVIGPHHRIPTTCREQNINRGSPEVFYKKGFLKNSAKLRRKNQCQQNVFALVEPILRVIYFEKILQ